MFHVAAPLTGWCCRYGLGLNNAILAEEKHLPLYSELVHNYDVVYIAGGATQNTIRVAQWMFRTPGCTGYMGAVGDDDYARTLEECCARDGVMVHYMHNPEVRERRMHFALVQFVDNLKGTNRNLCRVDSWRGKVLGCKFRCCKHF